MSTTTNNNNNKKKDDDTNVSSKHRTTKSNDVITISGNSLHLGSDHHNSTTTSRKVPTNRIPPNKCLSYALNFGVVVTLFLALVQLFDPTLDEHITNLQHEHELQIQEQFLLKPKTMRRRQRVVKRTDTTTTTNNNNNDNKKSKDKQPPKRKTFTLSEHSTNSDQDRLLQLLQDAGIGNLTAEQIENLPKWSDIDRLYGENIIVHGKESCSKYRNAIKLEDRIVGVAGMFNTGTNYLDKLLQYNLQGMEQESIWQVPWGKHRMAYVKWNHTAPRMSKYNKTNVFPVVVIRDPYSWMQSMCKAPYAAVWRHKPHHCPNLIPDPEIDANGVDRKHDVLQDPSFDVTIYFDEAKGQITKFTSLAHLWSEWYMLYLQENYPLLIIRYEDLVFQPGKVLKEIADCVGGQLSPEIKLLLTSSKSHGSHTDYVKAITKTSDMNARKRNMTVADFRYANEHFDPQLMNLFNYKHPSELE